MKSLVERIAELSNGSAAKTSQDIERSILDHLRRLLNTRSGEVLIRPDYGMPPAGELRARGGPRAVEAAIRYLVETFEPRLDAVVVRHVGRDDDQEMRLELVARLVRSHERVQYETKVDSQGKIEVG